jgi:glycosyltransferase involved in cell wall biosynthesis
VVFLAHQFDRTGAALLLLHCLEQIAVERDWQVTVVARRPGELGPMFERCSRVVYLTPPALAPLGRLAHRLSAGRWWRRAMLAFSSARGLNPDLVYSNTVTNDLEMRLIAPGVPVITHAHELSAASAGMRPRQLDVVIARTDRFIAVSSGVVQMLTSHGVQPRDIVVVPPGIPAPAADSAAQRQLGSSYLPDSETRFVVGGCGISRPEKGIDLFLDLADALLDVRDDVTLRWVGAAVKDLRSAGLARRADRHGGRVQFISPVEDVEPFYRSLDVFVLTSRLDPYPLVMIEAAANELPLVAFSGSGGADDFLAKAGQPLVAGWSATAMANVISALLDDPATRFRLGRQARRLASTHTVDRVRDEIVGQIEGLLARESVPADSRA